MIRYKRQDVNRLGRLFLLLLLSSVCLIALLYFITQQVDAWSGVVLRDSKKAEENVDPDIGSLNCQTSVSPCERTTNLVSNPGFQDGIGWQKHWVCESGCSCEVCESGHNSDASAKITGRDQECRLRSFPKEEIAVEAGKFYDYSAWILAGLLEGKAYLQLRFREGPPSWDTVYMTQTASVRDTSLRWVKVAGSAEAPSEAEYARVEVVVSESSDGTVWFDDIFLGLAACPDVSKCDYPDPVGLGQELTYTIVYSNVGRESATRVQIIDILDDHVDFRRAYPEPWRRGRELRWDIPELFPGDRGSIPVVVHVPEGALPGLAHLLNTVFITASEISAEKGPVCISNTTELITSLPGCALTVNPPLHPERLVNPGEAAIYDLRVYNAGQHDGTVTVVTSSLQGWDVSVRPTEPFSLAADDSKIVTVSPTAPECARSWFDEVDPEVTTITFTLEGASCGGPVVETAKVTTTVTRTSGVDIGPPLYLTSSPCDTVLFTHMVTNTGNDTDTIGFEVYSEDQWNTSPISLVTLGPCGSAGQSADVTLTVTVPCDVRPGTHTVVVTATSQNDWDAWGLVEDQVSINPDVEVKLPFVMGNYCSPTSICNGGFETCDFSFWEHEEDGLECNVVSPCQSGNCCALLGHPNYNCWGGVPLGTCWIEQTVRVPFCESPQLSFYYEVHTQDKLEVDGVLHDSFDVYLQGYRILRVGYTGNRYQCDNPKHVISGNFTVNLASPTDYLGTPIGVDFRDTNVSLRFENRTRHHEWYNTWTYIDDVELTCAR